MACAVCERKGWDHDKIVALCKESIFWTGYYLCKGPHGHGFQDMSAVLHLAIDKWVRMKMDEGWQRIMVLAPRGHFKTSLLTIAFFVWWWLRDPELRFLLMMHGQDMSIEKGGEIKDALEGDAMEHFFPDLHVSNETREKVKWAEKKFVIPRPSGGRRASVTCMGILGGKEGGHWPKIVWDDPIDGEADDSPQQTAAAIRKSYRVNSLWEDRKVDHWFLWGTMWPGGFYERMMARKNFSKLTLGCYCDDRFFNLLREVGMKLPSPDSPYYKKRVLEENKTFAWQEGTPIFPERETMRTLEESKDDLQENFAPQMLNLIIKGRDARFEAEMFPEYELRMSKWGRPEACIMGKKISTWPRLKVVVTVDPTGGMSPEADDAGVTVVAWDKIHAQGYLLDAWKDVADPGVQVDVILNMAEKWNADEIRPEHAAYQNTLSFWMRQKMKERGRTFSINPYLTGGKSKVVRILRGLHPFVKAGQLAVRLPDHNWVIDECCSLRIVNGQIIGRSPAILDSLAMHVPNWRRIKRKRRVYGQIRDETDDRPRRRRAVAYGLEAEDELGGYY